MKVYTTRVVTEARDTYVWVYMNEPTIDSVIKRLMDIEGFELDDPYNGYDWFVDTTSIYIDETSIIIEDEYDRV